MTSSEEMRIVKYMEDQQQIQAIHEQRITQVESRITTVEVRSSYMQDALNKLTSIADAQTKQGALTEAAVVALKDGQEQHSRHIEDLTKSHVDLKARFDALWRVLGTVGAALAIASAGYVFSLLMQHKP